LENYIHESLLQWLSETANVRVHGTTKEAPVYRLVIDRAAMGKVQADCYPSVERYDSLTDNDGMISFRGVRYSVDSSILSCSSLYPGNISIIFTK